MASVDRIQGLSGTRAIKVQCTVATTEHIVLSGLDAINSVALVAGDRVLVRYQNNAAENGIYVADTGYWKRSEDFDGANDVVRGTLVPVLGDGIYQLTTAANPIRIGTDPITLEVYSAAGTPTPYAALQRELLIAVGGETTIPLTEPFTGSADGLLFYRDGVLQPSGFSLNSPTEVAFTPAATAAEEIEVLYFNVAGVSAAVVDVAAISAEVATVAGIAGDVTAVAGNATNINAVAGNATNINAVAGNATNINAVAANETDIDTVAGIAADVSAVAAIDDDVAAVAAIAGDIPTAALIDAADLTTVANIATEVVGVAGISTEVQAVAGVSADIPAVAAIDTDITTAAQNIAAIQAAPQAAADAEAARDKAQQWAEEAEDVEVDPGEYSAFHWAQKAQDFATGAAANISYDNTTSGLSATQVQAALDELADEKQDTLVSGTNIKTVGGQSLLGSGNVSVSVPDGTTSVKGIVQLSTAVNSTSTTLAATPSAVKQAYDLAAAAASATYHAIGSYAFAYRTTDSSAPNTTVAGSALRMSGALGLIDRGSTVGAYNGVSTTALPGTWRCMGNNPAVQTTAGGDQYTSATLWVRIS